MDMPFSTEELAHLRAVLQANPMAASALSAPPHSQQPMSIPQPPSLLEPPPTQQLPSITHPPPITQLYQSSRQQVHGHPASSQSSTRFHPYSGVGTLGLATAHANQARMASASSTIPRSAGLPRRGSRQTRGPARPLPVLSQARKPKIDDCMVQGATLPTIRIKFLIYPPLHKKKQSYLVFRFLKDSFENWMEENGLLYRQEVALSEPLSTVLSQLTAAMGSSDMHFQFTTPHRSSLTVAAHERIPLQLLRANPRGIPRSSDGHLLLRRIPLAAGSTIGSVVGEMVSDTTGVVLGPNIDGNMFILRLAIRTSPIIHMKNGLSHKCLSLYFYKNFSDDGCCPDSGEETDSECGCDGESMDKTDDETEVADALTTLNPPRQTSRPVRSEPSLNTILGFLPLSIWQTGWSAPIPTSTYSIAELDSKVYNPEFPKLVVEGADVQALCKAFDTVLQEAVKTNDFRRLLATEREFNLNNPRSRLFSFGPGLEREVIFTTFQQYMIEQSAWFLPLVDDMASLQTSGRFLLARSISSDRLNDVKKLGALCALLLINGQCPDPFNPLIFQYLINDFNLHSLHERLVGEWHPELRATIRSWIDMGKNGDVTPFRSHFATYHNQSLGFLRLRNQDMHNKVGAEMLYNAILGPEPPSHPEWIAFREGFSLPCANGFNFCEIPKRFEGGSEGFFSLLWTAKIRSFDSIKGHLQFLRPPAGLLAELVLATGQPNISIVSLISTFLQGSGIPCQERFDSVKDQFSQLIDLSEDMVNDPAFRSRMFAWAATGCPHVDPRSEPIVVGIVPQSDQLYAANPAQGEYMAAQGKVSFRTCIRAARLPSSYVHTLATTNYSSLSPSEPQDFQQAFDYWFLCEILGAIGGISML